MWGERGGLDGGWIDMHASAKKAVNPKGWEWRGGEIY